MKQQGVIYTEPRTHAPLYVFDMDMFLVSRNYRDDMLTYKFGPPAYVEFNYFWVNPETPRALEMVLERSPYFAVWGAGDPYEVKAQWLYLQAKFDLKDPLRLLSDHDCTSRKHKFQRDTILQIRDMGTLAREVKWDTGYILMLGNKPEQTVPSENHFFITSWASVLGGGERHFSPVLTEHLTRMLANPQMLPLVYDLSVSSGREMTEAEKTHAWLVRNYVPVSEEQKDRRRSLKRKWTQREKKRRKKPRHRGISGMVIDPKRAFDEYEPECQ